MMSSLTDKLSLVLRRTFVKHQLLELQLNARYPPFLRLRSLKTFLFLTLKCIGRRVLI